MSLAKSGVVWQCRFMSSFWFENQINVYDINEHFLGICYMYMFYVVLTCWTLNIVYGDTDIGIYVDFLFGFT